MQTQPSPTATSSQAAPVSALPSSWQYIGVAVLGLSLFAIVLTGYPNFTDNEWRISAYVLDAVHNGRWFVQTDSIGDVASKPPALTWLVSIPVLLTGQITRLALYWPSAMATIITALVLLRAASRQYGAAAGHFAAFSYLVSYAALNQMEMPRYDGLLSLPVTLGALAAFHSWQTGKRWTLFWIIAAIGTLVKGPLALLLAGAGLLAVLFAQGENRRLRGSHWLGLLCFLLIAGGWFALAYWQMGDPLINKMIKRELVGHAVTGSSRGRQFLDFFTPLYDLFRSYAPWSLLTFVACWRAVWRPCDKPAERDFQRFLLAWILVGLVVFTASSHQRGRLILPLIPAAALLAAGEFNRWLDLIRPERLYRWTAVIASGFLLTVGVYSHVLIKRSSGVQTTLATKQLIDELHARSGGEFPFTYVDNCHPLQIWANTRRTMAPLDEAMKLLRGQTPAFVVVTRTTLPIKEGEPIHEVYRWPAKGKPGIRIFSNHPRLEWTGNAALWLDGVEVQLTDTRIEDGDEDNLRLVDDASGGQVVVVNRTVNAREMTLRLDVPGPNDLSRHEHLQPDIPVVFSWPAH